MSNNNYDHLLEYSVNDDGYIYNEINDENSHEWFNYEKRYKLLIFYICAFLFDFLFFIVETTINEPYGPPLDGHTHQFGWHFVHLTYWGGLLQTIYFLICIIDIYNYININKTRIAFHRHRNRFFTTAFAIGSMICVGFWIIIFPHDVMHGLTLFKFWGDFGAHGVTSILIFIELYIVDHEYGSWKEAFIPFIFTAIYAVWNLTCYDESKHWAYSIQGEIPKIARYFIYPIVPFISIGFYDIGRRLTKYIHKNS